MTHTSTDEDPVAVLDGHNDLPWAVRELCAYDLDAISLVAGEPRVQTDLPRLRAGGVSGQFWSVFVPCSLTGEAAVRATYEQIDFVQINYSLMEREAEERVFPVAQERGVAVIVNRPLGGGGLFGRVRGKPLPDWAKEFDCDSWAQFFLKWIVAHPAVTCAIPATSKVDHLIDNMQGGLGQMPDAAMRERIMDALARL